MQDYDECNSMNGRRLTQNNKQRFDVDERGRQKDSMVERIQNAYLRLDDATEAVLVTKLPQQSTDFLCCQHLKAGKLTALSTGTLYKSTAFDTIQYNAT